MKPVDKIKNRSYNNDTMWLAILFIIFTVAVRLIPHVPNFSPLVAIALFAGVYLRKRWAFIIPLVIYVTSDLIIGVHDAVLYTWGSMALIIGIGLYLKSRKTPMTILGGTLVSSILFFIVTNFGVWASGWYPRTLEGLIQCFTLAIPFFRTSLASNILYGAVLFGAYELITKKIRTPLKQTVS